MECSYCGRYARIIAGQDVLCDHCMEEVQNHDPETCDDPDHDCNHEGRDDLYL